jgi:hypothetical protein
MRALPGLAGPGLAFAAAAALALALHCTNAGTAGTCAPGDADGIQGGSYAFDLAVDDTAFSPTILKAENVASVSVTLTNTGTKPHGFVVECMPTPNDEGCPTTSCFPDASTIGPLPPDASATATFVTPNPEGIYVFRSDVSGDTQTGQFVVQ